MSKLPDDFDPVGFPDYKKLSANDPDNQWANKNPRLSPEQKHDIRLPQQNFRLITILVRSAGSEHLHSFHGRWLTQYLDWKTKLRYSVAETASHSFVAIVKSDNADAVDLYEFTDLEALSNSDLDISLKQATKNLVSKPPPPEGKTDD